MLMLEEKKRSPKYMAMLMKHHPDGRLFYGASEVLDAYGETVDECLADATAAIREEEEDADDWGYLQLFGDGSVRECDEYYLNRESGEWVKK